MLVRTDDGFAGVVLGECQKERPLRLTAPGASLKCLEEFEHALTTAFPAEEGRGAGLLGKRGLHGSIVSRTGCAKRWVVSLDFTPQRLTGLTGRAQTAFDWVNLPNAPDFPAE